MMTKKMQILQNKNLKISNKEVDIINCIANKIERANALMKMMYRANLIESIKFLSIEDCSLIKEGCLDQIWKWKGKFVIVEEHIHYYYEFVYSPEFDSLNTKICDAIKKPTKERDAHKEQIGGQHYLKHKIQSLDFVMKNDFNYLQGCIIKYVVRYEDKGGIEDLDKAIHCIELLKTYYKEKLQKKCKQIPKQQKKFKVDAQEKNDENILSNEDIRKGNRKPDSLLFESPTFKPF